MQKTTANPWPDNTVSPRLLRVLKLVVPLLVVAAEVACLFFLLDPQSAFLVIGLMVTYFLPPAGKESVIPAGILLGIPWWIIAPAIMMVDVETALFMNWNFDLALKIPYLGRIMEDFIVKSEEYLARESRLKRLYFSGIVILVMSPVMGSGGIRGSILGQLIGMEKPAIFTAILTGAVLGCYGIALGTILFREMFIRSMIVGSVVVLIIILAIGVYWIVSISRKKGAGG